MFLYYITKRLRGCLIFIILVLALITHAGTTGKITGTVVEKENGEPLYGVNVIVEGTSFGCATDANGYYAILNVTPGTYDVVFSMIGYSNTKYENIRIRIDQTTTLNAVLKSTILDLGESITVIGKKSIVQRDLTSTVSIVGSEEIRSMPVEDFSEVLEIQAG
ncbi:carboxypeptidase-like regulatory domain-containing protein, partial [bacterium]|nr:carboxypeptidase-like regulatory domain-containing protein [bacterium]